MLCPVAVGVLLSLLARRGEAHLGVLLIDGYLDWNLLLLKLPLEEFIDCMKGIEVTMKGCALERKSMLSFLAYEEASVPLPVMLFFRSSESPKREELSVLEED